MSQVLESLAAAKHWSRGTAPLAETALMNHDMSKLVLRLGYRDVKFWWKAEDILRHIAHLKALIGSEAA